VSPLSQLRRVLRLPTIVSTSAGLAFAAINFLALVQVATLMAGDSAWLAIVTAGVLCLLAAGVFGELNAIMPSAAGIRLWTRQGISDGFSLTFTLLYLTTILAVIAADSFILAQAIEAGIPQVPGLLWIVLFLFAALLFNLRGVKMAGRVQDTTTYVLLASLVLIAIAAIAHSHSAWHTPFSPGGGYLQAVAVGVFVFVGFEWVTPLAEEVTDSRLIPKGMFIAIGLIAIAFGLFILAMTHLLPAGSLGKTLVPQLLIGRTAFGTFGFWWMLLVTVITAGTTFNGSFVSASRLLYALARERSLPGWFSALNDRFVRCARADSVAAPRSGTCLSARGLRCFRRLRRCRLASGCTAGAGTGRTRRVAGALRSPAGARSGRAEAPARVRCRPLPQDADEAGRARGAGDEMQRAWRVR
jgi:amino acid transporter